MALLKCRECGAEINSSTRQNKCKECGTLFPFKCAVCGKLLRPPFQVYPEERFLTPDNEPLCEEHYQRQCPQCKKWFRADENRGFYLCPECTAERSKMVRDDSGDEEVEDEVAAPTLAETLLEPPGVYIAGVCVAVLCAWILLTWQ